MERGFWDDYREARGIPGTLWFWLHTLADLAFSIPAEIARELRQDLRYALRVHRQRSATTALALIALALAIGATTGVFSVGKYHALSSRPFGIVSGIFDNPLNEFSRQRGPDQHLLGFEGNLDRGPTIVHGGCGSCAAQRIGPSDELAVHV